MDDQFYLQDNRSQAYVCDRLLFWCFSGSGNVTGLGKAQLFTQDGACDHRDTDIQWPRAYVDARARVGVGCQYVMLSKVLDQYPDAAECYIQKPSTGTETIRFGFVTTARSLPTFQKLWWCQGAHHCLARKSRTNTHGCMA